MNRRDFIKVSAAGLGTLFVSGIGLNLIGKNSPAADAVTKANTVSASAQTKIVVVTGSPHRNGTSALLADNFIKGAQSKGHTVFRFNAAFEDIHPCQACNACGRNGPCVLNDAIEKKLMPQLLQADIIALITPLYYYGMSAQLKTVVDRFYSHLRELQNKKSLLLATAYNSADWTFDALTDHYRSLVEYMHWQELGTVLATGCGSRSVIERTQFPQYALQLGESL